VRSAPEFGIGAEVTKVDWQAIRDRIFTRVDQVSADGRRARAAMDWVTLLPGHARFAGRHELIIDDRIRISADRIVLATGATPVIPPVIAGAGVEFHTSDTIMRIDELPAAWSSSAAATSRPNSPTCSPPWRRRPAGHLRSGAA